MATDKDEFGGEDLDDKDGLPEEHAGPEDEPDQDADDDQDQEDDGGDESGQVEAQRGSNRQPDQVQRSGNSRRSEPEERREDPAIAELRAANQRMTAELEAMRQANQQPRETPEQKAARMALMTPEERLREEFKEVSTRMEADNRRVQLQLMDAQDRAAFAAKFAAHPLFKGMDQAVEQQLNQLRSQGQNAARDVIFTYLLGQKALGDYDKARGEQKSAGAQRIAKQKAPLANGRGDAVNDRRGRLNEQDARARRLANAVF